MTNHPHSPGLLWNEKNNLSIPNQNTILINIIWYYFIRYEKKYNEIQLTKIK